MPRTPIDYFKTIIYKIVCKDLNITDFYIGSTTEFTRRKNLHKHDSKIKDFSIYLCIRKNGGWDNWDMIEIEKHPCMDSNEKRKRERYWMEELKPTLNMIRTIITIDEAKEKKIEWLEENKEKMTDYFKKYNDDRKERRKEYDKNYNLTKRKIKLGI